MSLHAPEDTVRKPEEKKAGEMPVAKPSYSSNMPVHKPDESKMIPMPNAGAKWHTLPLPPGKEFPLDSIKRKSNP